MAQDLREMFRKEAEITSVKLPNGHQKRFAAKLGEALPQKKKPQYLFLKIAAVLVVALGVGFIFFAPQEAQLVQPGNEVVESPVTEEGLKQQEWTEERTVTETTEEAEAATDVMVSDLSPEFKKIESYYLASLNFELAKLEVTEENKALLDSFMEQLAGLEKEYQRLNAEFMEVGANEQTVEAMIRNLQLRLELLYKVKNKINEIKQSKNEEYDDYQA